MTWSPAALGIVITNNGSTIVGPPDPTGRGLVGVRERVELYGGTFQAGPRGEGGFRLAVTLPIA